MLKSRHRLAPLLMILLVVVTPAFGTTIYNVSIDTLAIVGQPGKVALDWVVNNPPGGAAEIQNFTATGSFVPGLPETEGGLVEGNSILPPFVPFSFTHIGGNFFFNELIVNFVQFGTGIGFSVSLPEIGPPPGGLPNQFSLFLLGTNYQPLFPTGDPLGANALFSVDVTGAPGGVLSVFSPAVFQAPNNILVTVPGNGVIPEPSSFSFMGLGVAALMVHWRLRRRGARLTAPQR